MLQTAYWALGIGLTMAGVGRTLQYQGEALKKSAKTQDIGRKSYSTGIAWTVMGGFIFLLGSLELCLVILGLIQ
jgi:hypothetical protein